MKVSEAVEVEMKKVKRVLLIDDDTISSWLNQTLLERTDMVEQIVTINSGKEAISYLQQHCSKSTGISPECPDLILLDLDMPEVNGFDVLDALQQSADCSWITAERLIVLTTTINPRELEKAKSYDILDFLIKPLTDTKITERLRLLINAPEPSTRVAQHPLTPPVIPTDISAQEASTHK